MAARRRPPAPLSALLLAALLALSLTACGEDGSPAPEPSPPTTTSTAEQPPPQQVPSIEGDDSAGSDASDPSADSDADDGSGGGDGGGDVGGVDGARIVGDGEEEPLTATVITGVWPDATWQIEEIEGDACGSRPPEISRWVLGEDYFSCGDPAARLLACKQEAGDMALCVRDPLEKTAVHIRSPEIEGFTAPAPEAPLPLMVILADGTTCTPAPRDDLEHHEGRQSWLHCGENAALLLDLVTATMYFDPSGPIWTAELGVGAAAPSEVEVREIIYAGTPEDVEAQGFRVG